MATESTTIAGFENVVIRAGECEVTVLQKFGGKIASIRIGKCELLQTPLKAIAPRNLVMGFDEGDAGGWDECLPSVAACSVETPSGLVSVPDHGDLWRVEWENEGLGSREQGVKSKANSDGSVTLSGKCFSLPLELERRIELREESGNSRLLLDYTIRNTGEHDVPWSWAAHPLFAIDPGDRIVLPQSIRSLRLEGSGGRRLGNSGDVVSWPVAKLADGRTADLSVAGAADSGIGDKLFAGPLERSENWCALERLTAGVRIRVKFDPSATPYLGLWICYGGWPERPRQKQVCVAMEPATAPVDSLAVTGPWSRVLAPGESFSWPMEVEIERIETTK